MENVYENYQSMVTAITTGISKLDDVCHNMSMDAQADALKDISRHLQNHVFSVGIMGEFKRGKSTVINALLGSKVVPADIAPCSATLNYIKWDAAKHAVVHFKDGTEKNISVDELSDYITKLTEESEKQSESVENATVYYPCRFCQNGVQIIDTPGLNDDERMNAISESVIPTLDAIIMVTVPGSPFGISEAEFIRNKVMTSDLGRIIFIVNKIDEVDEDDRERLLDYIKSKINKSVLEKIKAVFGENSDDYRAAREKLADIKVLGVSARQALKAKMNGDEKMLKKSGFNEFEQVLSKLLTEERGAIELIHPVNQIISTAKTSMETVKIRLNAMEMDAVSFEKIQQESMDKINDTRQKKKEEIAYLKAKGKTLYSDLLPDVAKTYEEISSKTLDYINDLSITEDNITDQKKIDEFADSVSAGIKKNLQDSFSTAADKLVHKVSLQLGKDVEELNDFGGEFNTTVDNINISLCTDTDFGKSGLGNADIAKTARDVIIDSVITYGGVNLFNTFIPGVGGLISGWRNHGTKGAVVGGAAGAGITLATCAMLGAFGMAGLPVALIAGVASTFGGKAVADLAFGKKKNQESADEKNAKKVSADDIRNQLIISTEKAVSEMKNNKVIENWLKAFCDNTYTKVADNIDQEWENTLITIEQNLSQIKTDIKMNDTNRQKARYDMEGYIRIINSVINDIRPIQEKLSGALKD